MVQTKLFFRGSLFRAKQKNSEIGILIAFKHFSIEKPREKDILFQICVKFAFAITTWVEWDGETHKIIISSSQHLFYNEAGEILTKIQIPWQCTFVLVWCLFFNFLCYDRELWPWIELCRDLGLENTSFFSFSPQKISYHSSSLPSFSSIVMSTTKWGREREREF